MLTLLWGIWPQSLATEENPDGDAGTAVLRVQARDLLQRYFLSESSL